MLVSKMVLVESSYPSLLEENYEVLLVAVLQPILIERTDHVFTNISIYIFKVFISRVGLKYFMGCSHEPMAYRYEALNLWLARLVR